jgi:hypothetical protein
MSRVRADKLVDRNATGAPSLTYGVEVPVGYGITGAGGINVSGMVTATAGFDGNATGLTGTPNITVGNISASGGDLTIRNITGVAATFTGALTYEDVTNVDSTGIVTARGGFKAGAPTGVGATIGVDNAGDAIFSGIVTAGTCFKAGSVSGGAFGAGVGVTITGDGNAVFSGIATAATLNVSGESTLGVTSVTTFDASSTLVEAFSSTTTAWSSTADLNITNGNVQFCSAVLGGTTNTLNILSTTGINTDLAIGQNLSVTGITSVNASTAYVNNLTIDGVATKVWWTGGSAPTDGGGSGMDLYTFNIMKIGSAQFYVIGTQTKTS